ncbi:hypothetical protein C8R44DRAFT_417243 [Mycena epipterygia]|nr:hypothetical protein C8R44DRAFT_417243 [Mycena epipterygia]
MDSLNRVVKVEKSTPESLNLRRIFGPPCGEIRALHASGFIEYADAAGADRALALAPKLDIAGVRVLNVASQPRLVDQYRVVNPSAFSDDMQSNAGTGRSSGVRNDLGGMDRALLARPDPPLVPPSVPETGVLLQALKSSDTPVSRPSIPPASAEIRNISSNVILPPRSLPAALPSLAGSSPSAVNPFPCIESHILMRLCGENITLDLRSLAGDPASVIELLKVTASERGNWLIVGAYYRRIGNPEGAKAVVTAMLEALKQFNIPESDLKPAFLLLSGCESDLGKIARATGDATKVSEHYSNAQKWLHKVYGTSTPPLASSPSSVDDPKRTIVDDSKRPIVLGPPRAPASLRSRIDTSAPSAPRSHPPSPNHRLLEREIQSLRDRHTYNTNVISDIRSEKRRLEEAVEMERNVRRKVQRELDEVVKERDTARRMEHLAVDQMKREVDSRRRAEDRAEEQRDLRKRAESSADFATLHRTAYMTGVPRMTPMAPPESFSAFDPHAHRISF